MDHKQKCSISLTYAYLIMKSHTSWNFSNLTQVIRNEMGMLSRLKTL